ncbi:hypothetical protein V8E54_003835 [Elaphomyces granulatus]
MSSVNSLWFKWKSLRLPWRRSFLVGVDLAGNTFWEFKDAINSNRYRRIVKYNRSAHYADIKITPQWHQWLRYVRQEAPSLEEQHKDIMRQRQLKQLARLADERWANKPSYLDHPRNQQTAPVTRLTENPIYRAAPEGQTTAGDAIDGPDEAQERQRKETKEISRIKQTGGPSEKWQPGSWTPTVSSR